MKRRVLALFVIFLYSFSHAQDVKLKCQLPPEAPPNIKALITLCQDEIKSAVLTAAENFDKGLIRRKRSTFSSDEQRIAGCLLHCVYRKMNALNKEGFPTTEGLLDLYTEGTTDKEYHFATVKAVQFCQANAQDKYLSARQRIKDNEIACDMAFEAFDCISTQIAEYCGQTP